MCKVPRFCYILTTSKNPSKNFQDPRLFFTFRNQSKTDEGRRVGRSQGSKKLLKSKQTFLALPIQQLLQPLVLLLLLLLTFKLCPRFAELPPGFGGGGKAENSREKRRNFCCLPFPSAPMPPSTNQRTWRLQS